MARHSNQTHTDAHSLLCPSLSVNHTRETELAHIALGHRLDPRYAFFDQTLFDDKKTFQNLVFARDPSEEEAAGQKAMEFMKKSPYKDSLGSAARFLQALNARTKIPNLVSPHLGSGALMIPEILNMNITALNTKGTSQLAALRLGARRKTDPSNGSVDVITAKPTGRLSEREKMPFEVTPFMR